MKDKELKTLKDLKHKYRMLDGDFEWIMVKELKAEAAKWVKEYRSDKFNKNAQANVLIKFFNLTEEDLK